MADQKTSQHEVTVDNALAETELVKAANALESVFLNNCQGFTTMNHFATDIFLLTTFIKNGNWKWKG